MARLLTLPAGIGIKSLDVVDDPNTRNSGSQTAQDGIEQTFDGIGQVWAFHLGLTISQGLLARRMRGTLDALLGGANAIRVKLDDPDVMTPAEAGIVGELIENTPWEIAQVIGDQGGVPWSNGMPWSNGLNWQASYPTVKVAESASADTTIIKLQDEFWGHSLGMGDRFGFCPFHFGMYEVTQVIAPGTYRVKYSLRKAITFSATPALCDRATLFPTIVVRPMGKAGAKAPARGLAYAEETTIAVTEVVDAYVRSDYTD